jgi:uncharacterized DUF497 family protein
VRRLPIGWSSIDERENLKANGIDFKLAAEVVRNSSSLRIRNMFSDYLFIGPTNDLSKILSVECILEEDVRKITSARIASAKETNSYFEHLSEGKLI